MLFQIPIERSVWHLGNWKSPFTIEYTATYNNNNKKNEMLIFATQAIVEILNCCNSYLSWRECRWDKREYFIRNREAYGESIFNQLSSYAIYLSPKVILYSNMRLYELHIPYNTTLFGTLKFLVFVIEIIKWIYFIIFF